MKEICYFSDMMCKAIDILKEITCVLILLVVVLISNKCYGSTEILNVRHWAAPDHTRIVLDVDGAPDYEVKEGENLLILSFKESSLSKSIPDKIIINKPGIKTISFYSVDENMILVKLILDQHRKAEVFKLKKFQDKPDRVVVDIILEQASKEEKIPEKISESKKKIIVIDPGHGGEDPGAVGKKGTYEKNIVLAISRELKNTINKIPGYRAVLTREGDYYVSFSKRLQKAKKLGAVLFISIHTNAAKNRSARGSSVYCLSNGAATNEAVKLLASNENLSDILGGVPESEGKNESNQIIMNMFQTDTINLSKIYAGILMKHLDMVNCLKYKSVQEAPFRVLKLPDVPAVLIETAFISNIKEENLLRKSSFQKNLAMEISSSIKDYFAVKDQEPQRAAKVKTTKYFVKRGDTLFTISENFNTKVGVLLKLNDMKLDDSILIGQEIIVPADEKDQSEKQTKPSKFYTVQKGDTLFIVARKNSTTLEELLETNNMKITDPLFYGKRIKIPSYNSKN